MKEPIKYTLPKTSLGYFLQGFVKEALEEVYKLEKETDEIHIEIPNDNNFGDYATNVAMALAKVAGENPRTIAEKISNAISSKHSDFVACEVAGPGFINFKINLKNFADKIIEIVNSGDKFGQMDFGKGKKIMIEFGQPNTHKAFHVGHLKSAVSGLAMVGLHEVLGYEVIKANYFGDVGMHVAKSIWGFLKKGKPDNFETIDQHERMKFIDDCYVYGSKEFKENKSAEEEIREINQKIYSKEDPEINKIYEQTRAWSLQHLNSVFAELGVVYDVQYPESTIAALGVEIVNKYKDQIFTKSEGAIIFDGSKVGLTTWVFLTKENLPTYSAKDLGLANKKFQDYNPDMSIVTTSVEQTDYFKVIIHCLEKIHPEFTNRYRHIPFGWLLRNNKKASSRMGGTIKGMDVINEAKSLANDLISSHKEYSDKMRNEISHAVAMSGLKFLILSHEFHKNINYDPESFISLDGFSGPYILYTYARAKSVLTKYSGKLENEKIRLEKTEEINLAKMLSKYEENVCNSALKIAPHTLCTYLYQLAQSFNQLYTNLPILEAESEEARNTRIALSVAAAQVIANGFKIFGIDVVERM